MNHIRGNNYFNLDFSQDLHTHPFERGKSYEAMEAFVQRAIELGLTGIALTDHAPMASHFATKHCMSVDDVERYLNYSEKLRDKYFNDIQVFTGFEADYHPDNIEMINNLRKNYRFDLLIGAVHLHTLPWKDTVIKMNREELVDFAFKQTIDLINTGLFDVLYIFVCDIIFFELQPKIFCKIGPDHFTKSIINQTERVHISEFEHISFRI